MRPIVESIWNECAAKLGPFIAARVADPATAEDIFPDAFLRIHTPLGQIMDGRLRTKGACVGGA